MSISAQFLTENKSEALALLKQSLTQPRFDQSAIDRVRAQVISGINSDEKNPNRIAGAFFDQAAFGDHPYGTNMDGTVETLNAITQDVLFEAHRNALTRDRMEIDEEELDELQILTQPGREDDLRTFLLLLHPADVAALVDDVDAPTALAILRHLDAERAAYVAAALAEFEAAR